CRPSMHVSDLDAATGDGGEDPHERALRVAIVDVEYVHGFPPKITSQITSCGDGRPRPSFRAELCSRAGVDARPYIYSSSNSISESAAPAGTIGYTFASGAQSNTSNSGSGDFRKRSNALPVSSVTGYSLMASSFRRSALMRYAFAISTKSGLSLRSVSA